MTKRRVNGGGDFTLPYIVLLLNKIRAIKGSFYMQHLLHLVSLAKACEKLTHL